MHSLLCSLRGMGAVVEEPPPWAPLGEDVEDFRDPRDMSDFWDMSDAMLDELPRLSPSLVVVFLRDSVVRLLGLEPDGRNKECYIWIIYGEKKNSCKQGLMQISGDCRKNHSTQISIECAKRNTVNQ